MLVRAMPALHGRGYPAVNRSEVDMRLTVALVSLAAAAAAQVSQHKFPVQGPQPGTMSVVRAFPSLSFTRPLYLTAAPDQSNRIFVVEQGGRILVFPNNDTVTTTKVFLDLSTKVSRASNE